MKHLTTRHLLVPLSLLLVAALAACGNVEGGVPTTEDVQSRLELDNGGFALEDEVPVFGDAELFESAGLMEAQLEVDDTLVDTPEVMALSQPAPGVTPPRRFVLVAVWGQPTVDWNVPQFADWSGSVSVSKGAVLARRTVRFDAEDTLLPRTDPKVLPFVSYTQPHHDGLVVNIFDNPDPSIAIAGEVTLQLAHLPQPVTIPFDQLDGFRLLVTVDNLGNKLLIAAEEIPLNSCGAGFLLGHWHRLTPSLGFFLGQWSGEAGALHGHLMGIYGVNAANEQIFFGKYIGVGGQARGVLAGGYGGGHFTGLWHGVNGPEGVIGGVYHDTLAGPESGGLFLGGWARTNCP